MEVINWLRQIIGYNLNTIDSIYDIGGMVTTGGVMSNAYALMLAYNKFKYKNKKVVILPDEINHYSLYYSLTWLNQDVEVIFCKIKNFRLNLEELEKLIRKFNDNIIFIGAYACDSRVSVVDNLEDIAELRKIYNLNCWLHCDACHGFVLGFSEKYKHYLKGISKFDSITMDPHKVLWLPYTISVILLRNKDDIKYISKENELIMQSKYALGKTTPFIGSKAFDSIKLWMLIKTLGVSKIGDYVEKRISNALIFFNYISCIEEIQVFDSYEVLFSIIFQFKCKSIEESNEINQKIYDKLLNERKYYFHGFFITINGEKRFVLRYNSGNISIEKKTMKNAIEYIINIGKELINGEH